MAVKIFDAIKAIMPNAEFGVEDNDYNKIDWYSDPSVFAKPTKEVVDAKVAELQAAYNAKEYQRDRADEYPPIGDQLDALYHAGIFPTEMANAIKAIKDKYPKG